MNSCPTVKFFDVKGKIFQKSSVSEQDSLNEIDDRSDAWLDEPLEHDVIPSTVLDATVDSPVNLNSKLLSSFLSNERTEPTKPGKETGPLPSEHAPSTTGGTAVLDDNDFSLDF